MNQQWNNVLECSLKWEALNYKFKQKRVNKSLSDVDRVAQWFTAEYLINQIAIKTDFGVATHKGPNICTHYRSWPWINQNGCPV